MRAPILQEQNRQIAVMNLVQEEDEKKSQFHREVLVL